MVIQSLSIVVPTRGCMNKCKFCVSRMRKDNYLNLIGQDDSEQSDFYINEYAKRLAFARDNGCNTVMLTGQGEPQQNKDFIYKFSRINNSLEKPFRNIEIQTTGAKLTEDDIRAFREFGICTVSLSISCLNSLDVNASIINDRRMIIDIPGLCGIIKKHNLNLRLSLNMTDLLFLSNGSPDKDPKIKDIFDFCKRLEADQVTFRKMFVGNIPLWVNGGSYEQDKWIMEHSLKEGKNGATWFDALNTYVKCRGKYLDTLEYGNDRYSVDEMSVVIDEDCMAKDNDKKQALKYLILRPNCKLYSKWDDKGSLIF